MFTTSTKAIARKVSLPVAVHNEAAPALGIASYRPDLRPWRIPSLLEAQFVEHLQDAA